MKANTSRTFEAHTAVSTPLSADRDAQSLTGSADEGKSTSIRSYLAQSNTQLAMPDSVVSMIALDQIKNPDIRERFMIMVENRDDHDKDIEERAFEREEARADHKLEADIKLRNASMSCVFVLFLILAIGFIICAAMGVDSTCLWAFSIFFAPAGIALFVNFFNWKNNKPGQNS